MIVDRAAVRLYLTPSHLSCPLQVTGVGYNGDGMVVVDDMHILGYQSPSVARVVEVSLKPILYAF